MCSPVRLLMVLWSVLAPACATGNNTDVVDSAPPTDAPITGQPDARPLADARPTVDGAATPDAPAAIDAARIPDAPIADAGSSGTGDTCAEAIDLTAAASEPGGTTDARYGGDYHNMLEPPSACTDGYGEDGPDVIYYVVATAGQNLHVVLTPELYDGAVYILADCTDDTTCLTGSDSGFVGGAETLDFSIPSDGTYFIVADSYLSDEYGDFVIAVTLT